MKRLCTALALALLAGCTPALAQELNVRQFDRTVDPRNVTTTDKLTWYAGESIEYIVRSRRGREVVDVPPESTVVWRVRQDTNDYLVAAGEVVTNGTVRFAVSAPAANLPAGAYTSWAQAYQGTNLVGVLDRTSVEVKWRPGDDYAIVPPITNLFDQVLAAWNTECSAALAAALAAVAGVESNVTALAETVGGITAESLGALTAETDPAWTAASGSVVYATTPGYTAAVEQAASAYGWGDHSAAGYLTEETDTAALSAVAAVSGRVDTVEGWGDHSAAGYLTEETDAAALSAIAAVSGRVDTVEGWGDHAEAGYLTAEADAAALGVIGSATNALLDLAGARAMTGNLNMADGNITNVNNIDVATLSEAGSLSGIDIADSEFTGQWNFADQLTVRGSKILLESTLIQPSWVTSSAAYTNPISLPHLFTTNLSFVDTVPLPESATRVFITTTNDESRSSGNLRLMIGDVELASYMPECDGSTHQLDFSQALVPTGSSIRVVFMELPSASGVTSAPPSITDMQVWTMADPAQVGRRLDTANSIYEGDDPLYPRQWLNLRSGEALAAAALAAANAETHYRTAPTDLQGQPVRWNPRFDTVAASNSLSTLYGGSTALRLDGEGAAVVPEIRAFAVESGEVATLTVWSYSGGATNLVPEVTTNLITGIWERKPESIVSATNIDAFTAQVVFTNDFERLLYVRLVDVSGGTGVPVLRVFGGIAFGDGEAITDWPQGTILGATINGPHTVATNDGILEFTVASGGTGWTNLAFSGTGNAITGATAAADTLTLQRGEIEGGTPTTNALLDLAGTRAMTGPLNMNSNAITKVSYVTGDTGKGLFFDDNSLDFWDSSAIFNADGTNVWQGRVNDTEASRIAALAEGAGGGNLIATNTPTAGQMLYASGTDNSTLYWAAAPEGSTGTASVGVEGDVLTYPFATNIALLASTNLWPQRILEVTNDFTLQVPTMADTNAAGIIWLTVPSISTHTATIPTSSPAILGYVPSLSTNAESELLFRWTPQATGWRMWRFR
jgi:hypothetical protein